MRAVRTTFRRLRSDKRGATAIEYGLIAGLIAMGLIAGLSALGGGTNGLWGKIGNDVAAVM